MAIRVPFYVVDVFASQPLTGSPLPLLPDADGLDEAQLRAVAREFSQPETTFLLRPSRPGATVRIRSFTPAGARLAAAGQIPHRAAVVIEQGHALGRPSQIRVEVSGPRIRVGGSGLVVAEGTLSL